MQPSINAVNLLASHALTLLVEPFEGDKHEAYQDGNGIWTIGYGHTGPDVTKGLVWTESQAIAALTHDFLRSENDICSMFPAIKLNQNQFDALSSFDYNLGRGHVSSSSVARFLLAGDFQKAADAMLMWDKVGGAVSAGLLRRRQAERALFLKPVAA